MLVTHATVKPALRDLVARGCEVHRAEPLIRVLLAEDRHCDENDNCRQHGDCRYGQDLGHVSPPCGRAVDCTWVGRSSLSQPAVLISVQGNDLAGKPSRRELKTDENLRKLARG